MEFFGSLLSLFLIDLILGGDNAIIIALASRDLPKSQRIKAIFWGTACAIVMRIVFATIATRLLQLPYLKLIGGIILIYIAFNLARQKKKEIKCNEAATVWEAVRIIFTADLIMSLDNVLAIAGIANGNILLLVTGLLLSIPCVVISSQLIIRLLEKYRFILYLCIAILCWTALNLILHDAALGGKRLF